jgi:glycosyltransferase involved in cell wall biosynthesis
MTALAALSVLTALAWLLGLLTVRRMGRLIPRLADAPTADAEPGAEPVSVVIPARNESLYLGACLASLAGERAICEIVVVDDRSTDDTRAVAERAAARDPRIRVLDGSEPPAGWTGKNHALSRGAAAAGGEYLLFLDADAVLARGAVAASVTEARAAGADLLSALPAVQTASFAEALVAPTMALLILVGFDPRRVNDPDDPTAMAPGSYLLFRRRAYEALGGHGAVRDDPVEDLHLAQEVKRRGMRLRLVAAPERVATRRLLSFRRLWQGWYRVVWRGLGERAWLGFVAAAALALFFLAPFAASIAGAAALVGARSATVGAAAWVALAAGPVHLALFVALRAALGRYYGVDGRYAWLQPLGALFVIALLLAAATMGALGRHTARWSGRSYRD